MTNDKHTMKPEITRAVLALGLGALASLATGCSTPEASASPSAEPAPLEVDAIVANLEAVPRTLALTGTLAAQKEAEVAADGSGRVIATYVDRGDLVELGAPLARLDARAAALGRQEAEASRASLSAQSENAKLECARAERLFTAKVISRAEYDSASTSCKTSGFSLEAARAREGMASKSLSDSLIRAPFRGVVGERRVSVGDYVNPGRSVLTLVDASSLRLEVRVPETATASVAAGRRVSFGVAAYPKRTFSGRIARLAPSLRAATRDQIVEVSVDNADGALRPGMFATVRLVIGEDKLPVVPATAVLGQAPSERVFVVTREFRVEERVVSTGERVSAGVALEAGLQAGEAVVAVPPNGIRDGARVK
jgi:membrane fusion protein (multidrug efflux system)